MRTPEMNREIATTADGIDITRGYTGPLLAPYDSVLRARGGNDFVIYEQVLSDPEVKATFGQRQLAVTRCEWQVDAGGTKRIDKQAAEYLREQLAQRVAWDNITTKMLYGVFFGFAVAEVIYRRDGARVGLETIKVRNRRRFRYAKDGGLRLLTMHSMTEGVPCDRPYFWDFQCGADNDDEPYGQGLAHWLYWPVLFKRNGIKFWLTFLEKFGSPTAVGTYDREATTEERARLLAACRAVQTDAGIILPKGMEITLLEAARSGTSDYKTLHDTMDATIQKVVLGQTASTQGTAGKLGNDDLQGDVRDDIIAADADLVCESFNRGPARWLTEWNFPGAALPRVFRVTEKAEDLSARAKRDKDLKDIGYRPTLAVVEEVYGQGYEAVAVPAPVPVVAPDDPAAAFAAPAAKPAVPAFVPPDLAALDDLLDAIESGATLQEQAAQLVQPLIDAARQPDFAERLGSLYPELDDSALQDALERLAFAAQVWGTLNADRR